MGNRAIQNCLKKKRFLTEDSAWNHLYYLARNTDLYYDYEVYRCPICEGYHYTTMKTKRRPKRGK